MIYFDIKLYNLSMKILHAISIFGFVLTLSIFVLLSTKQAPKFIFINQTANNLIERPRSLPESQKPNLNESRSINCRRMMLDLTHPQRSVVASLGNGRLGNQLSNFATCYAIQKEYKMYHYLNTFQLELLTNVFDFSKVPIDADDSSYYLWDEGKF